MSTRYISVNYCLRIVFSPHSLYFPFPERVLCSFKIYNARHTRPPYEEVEKTKLYRYGPGLTVLLYLNAKDRPEKAPIYSSSGSEAINKIREFSWGDNDWDRFQIDVGLFLQLSAVVYGRPYQCECMHGTELPSIPNSCIFLFAAIRSFIWLYATDASSFNIHSSSIGARRVKILRSYIY